MVSTVRQDDSPAHEENLRRWKVQYFSFPGYSFYPGIYIGNNRIVTHQTRNILTYRINICCYLGDNLCYSRLYNWPVLESVYTEYKQFRIYYAYSARSCILYGNVCLFL